MATGCKQKNDSRVYVVVGGGIAGVSCAEEVIYSTGTLILSS